LKTLAQTVTIDNCLRILGRIDATQEALSSNANTQLAVENLLLDLPELGVMP
jgi:hypothetical protein